MDGSTRVRSARTRVRQAGIATLVALALLGVVIAGREARQDSASAFTAPGFTADVIAGEFGDPVDFDFAPDGRIFVAQRHGEVRIVDNGVLLTDPFYTVTVNTYVQRGLMGLALDPAFASNGYVYLYYTHEHDESDPAGAKTGRLVRVTADGNVAVLGSEHVLLGTDVADDTHSACDDYPAGTDCLPADGCCHVGGGMRFAPDGSLFVSTGDAADTDGHRLRAQDLDSLAGKVLRIDPATGRGLADNPFFTGDPSDNRSKVWAYGFREVFRFGLHPETALPVVGDVGSIYWEEINVVKAGANYGWPCYEGAAQHAIQSALPECQAIYAAGSPVEHPAYSYQHGGGGASITGGVFYTADAYPAAYQGAYVFGEFIGGHVQALQLDSDGMPSGDVQIVDSEADVHPLSRSGPVDFEIGPEGDVYYLAFHFWSGTGELRRLRYSGETPPVAVASASPASGPRPLAVAFNADASFDPGGEALTYRWDFGDGTFSTEREPRHTFTSDGVYQVTLTVTSESGGQDTAEVGVQVGTPPTAVIDVPQHNASYQPGATILYSGRGMLPGGQSLPPAGLSWAALLHHCEEDIGAWHCHWHLYDESDGAAHGTLIGPNQGEDLMYLELRLQAADQLGLKRTTFVFLGPDSDGDGLLDKDEALLLRTDHFNADSNGNGVSDGLEDTDGDGCSDAAELGPSPREGGRRDPTDPWDFYDPSGDGRVRVDDLTRVVERFGADAGEPAYGEAFDRSRAPAGEPWRASPPDGRIRVDDIVTLLGSMMHTCR